MRPVIIYWIVFAIILSIFLYFDIKYDLLKDSSTANKRPYSYSRVQLAWWTLIVLTSFITIFFLNILVYFSVFSNAIMGRYG